MLAKIEPVAKPLTICWARSCTSARKPPERRKPSDARRGEIFRQRSRRTCDFGGTRVFWRRYAVSRAAGTLESGKRYAASGRRGARALVRIGGGDRTAISGTGDRSGEVFGRGCVDGPARQRRHARDAAGTTNATRQPDFSREIVAFAPPSEIVAASPSSRGRRGTWPRETHDSTPSPIASQKSRKVTRGDSGQPGPASVAGAADPRSAASDAAK